MLNHAGLLLLPSLATAISLALIIRSAIFSTSDLSKLLPFLLLISTAFLIIQVLGILCSVRILGRHVIPILMVWSLALGLACSDARKSPRQILRFLPVFILLVFLVSSLLYRFGSAHQKDSYREAAAWALEQAASGKKVLWAADSLTGMFYGLNNYAQHPSRIILQRDEGITDLSEIDAIALSKPDIYDPKNAIRQGIHSVGFDMVAEMEAFTLWEKQKPE